MSKSKSYKLKPKHNDSTELSGFLVDNLQRKKKNWRGVRLSSSSDIFAQVCVAVGTGMPPNYAMLGSGLAFVGFSIGAL